MNLRAVAVISVAVVFAVGHAVAGERAALAPCEVPGIPRDGLCGTLSVPEDRFTGEGRRIELNVLVLPATGAQRAPDPLFVFEGGPGASAVQVANAYAQVLAGVRERRDLVLIDSRGTGQSNPLQCDSGGDGFPIEAVTACHERLVESADLRMYNTTFVVDDADDVRAWLGYQRINVFGMSYGSRTALTYLRRHEARTRSVLLLATYPHDKNVPLEAASIAERSLGLLIEDCAADARCGEAFPGLAGDLEKVVAQLDEHGSVETKRGGTVDRASFGSLLRMALFSPATAGQLPRLIHRAARQDFAHYDFIRGMISRQLSGWISFGHFFSVLCSEDLVRIGSVDEIDERAAGTVMGPAWSRELHAACAAWTRAPLPEGFHEPVTSEVPVLMLHGRLDPSMPPEWSHHAARSLPNARVVEVPAGYHNFIGLTDPGCLQQLIEDFVVQGSTAELDAACVNDMQRPPFNTSR